MKRMTAIVAMAAFLLLGSARLQAQNELLWGIGGFFLGSAVSGDGVQPGLAGMNGGIIYIMPGLAKRLNPDDWLQIKQLCVVKGFNVGNWKAGKKVKIPDQEKLIDLFREGMKEETDSPPEKFVILQITKVLNPKDLTTAYFWFYYIERAKLKPMPASK
jgi:hypothetical protein